MATIAPIEVILINNLTVGVDTYPDLKGISWQRAAPAVYRYRGEASLAPTKITPVASDAAPITGRITGKTTSMDALSGVSQSSVTFSGTNAVTGATVTGTITNVQFMGFSAGGGETQPENSSLEFEATNIAVA